MIKEYIIGREGDQKYKIEDKYGAVSRHHAKLTVNEGTGEWRLSDMESANGTFIIDPKGNLIPVTTEGMPIKPTTRISLGGLHHKAFTIVAHALIDEKENYGPDFDELEQKLADWKDKMKKKKNGMKYLRVVLSLLPIACLLIPGIGIEARFVGVSVASVLNALLASFVDPSKLAEERSLTIVCPKCGRALTDMDVKRHCCPNPACGAK